MKKDERDKYVVPGQEVAVRESIRESHERRPSPSRLPDHPGMLEVDPQRQACATQCLARPPVPDEADPEWSGPYEGRRPTSFTIATMMSTSRPIPTAQASTHPQHIQSITIALRPFVAHRAELLSVSTRRGSTRNMDAPTVACCDRVT